MSRTGRSSTAEDCGGDAMGGACIGAEVLARRAAASFTAADAEADAEGSRAAGPASACMASCTAVSAASSFDLSPSNSVECECWDTVDLVTTVGVPMLAVAALCIGITCNGAAEGAVRDDGTSNMDCGGLEDFRRRGEIVRCKTVGVRFEG
mmetsp:Transcript_19/g.32  ORF Transcript_19/g.32 Transcript_19/m.32 type:complete len:151 (+) Transcript_19:1952-2404(+)